MDLNTRALDKKVTTVKNITTRRAQEQDSKCLVFFHMWLRAI